MFFFLLVPAAFFKLYVVKTIAIREISTLNRLCNVITYRSDVCNVRSLAGKITMGAENTCNDDIKYMYYIRIL